MLHRTKSALVALIVASPLLISPGTAEAYVGPGAGLAAIGTVVALLAAVLLLVAGFVWYPVKRLLALRRKPQPNSEPGPELEPREG